MFKFENLKIVKVLIRNLDRDNKMSLEAALPLHRFSKRAETIKIRGQNKKLTAGSRRVSPEWNPSPEVWSWGWTKRTPIWRSKKWEAARPRRRPPRARSCPSSTSRWSCQRRGRCSRGGLEGLGGVFPRVEPGTSSTARGSAPWRRGERTPAPEKGRPSRWRGPARVGWVRWSSGSLRTLRLRPCAPTKSLSCPGGIASAAWRASAFAVRTRSPDWSGCTSSTCWGPTRCPPTSRRPPAVEDFGRSVACICSIKIGISDLLWKVTRQSISSHLWP